MKSPPFSIGLGICLLALAAPAAGEVEPLISYRYYPVNYTGNTSVEAMIIRDSPLPALNGRRPSGHCQAVIGYDPNTVTSPSIGVCRIQDPKVNVACEISLPRLAGGESDPKIRAEFAAKVESLRQHELEHCRIAVRHANDLLAAFNSLKDRKCEDMHRDMREEHKKVHEAHVRDQKNYDNAEYGYEHHLRLEGLQRMMDAGFDVLPPSEPNALPDLKREPIHKNLEVVIPQGTEDLTGKGIYKDKDGVWRNY